MIIWWKFLSQMYDSKMMMTKNERDEGKYMLSVKGTQQSEEGIIVSSVRNDGLSQHPPRAEPKPPFSSAFIEFNEFYLINIKKTSFIVAPGLVVVYPHFILIFYYQSVFYLHLNAMCYGWYDIARTLSRPTEAGWKDYDLSLPMN